MRNTWLVSLLFICVVGTNCAVAQHTKRNSDLRYEAGSTPATQLNNKRLEKNLAKHLASLNLTPRQTKQMHKVDRRYARLERKISRKGGSRKDKKLLAEEKRKDILEILTAKQQLELADLSRKGRFSFDNLFHPNGN